MHWLPGTPEKQPLGRLRGNPRDAWEGVHRAVTREPGDLPAHRSLLLLAQGLAAARSARLSDEPCGRGRIGVVRRTPTRPSARRGPDRSFAERHAPARALMTRRRPTDDQNTAIFMLLAATAVPAMAQTNPTLPTTDAAGEHDRRHRDAGRATRFRLQLLGASVTVLDAAALDARQTRVVSDVLRDVPGVAVSRTGGDRRADRRSACAEAEANQTLVLDRRHQGVRPL